MAAPNPGALSQFAVDSVAPIDVSSTGMEFVSYGIKRQDTHVESGGIRGTRSRHSSRVRLAQTAVAGTLVMHPSATELDWWIQRILGGTTAAGVTDVADALPTFATGIKRGADWATHSGLVVSRATLSGSPGQPIQLSIDVEGTDETVGAIGTWPAVTLPTDNMFVFSDLAATIDSVATTPMSFSMTVDNLVDAGRWTNSLTRTYITAQDRAVTVDLTLPYETGHSALEDLSLSGVAGSVVITDGSVTYTVDLGNKVFAEAQGVEIPGKSELVFQSTLRTYYDGTKREIKITKT